MTAARLRRLAARSICSSICRGRQLIQNLLVGIQVTADLSQDQAVALGRVAPLGDWSIIGSSESSDLNIAGRDTLTEQLLDCFDDRLPIGLVSSTLTDHLGVVTELRERQAFFRSLPILACQQSCLPWWPGSIWISSRFTGPQDRRAACSVRGTSACDSPWTEPLVGAGLIGIGSVGNSSDRHPQCRLAISQVPPSMTPRTPSLARVAEHLSDDPKCVGYEVKTLRNVFEKVRSSGALKLGLHIQRWHSGSSLARLRRSRSPGAICSRKLAPSSMQLSASRSPPHSLRLQPGSGLDLKQILVFYRPSSVTDSLGGSLCYVRASLPSVRMGRLLIAFSLNGRFIDDWKLLSWLLFDSRS